MTSWDRIIYVLLSSSIFIVGVVLIGMSYILLSLIFRKYQKVYLVKIYWEVIMLAFVFLLTGGLLNFSALHQYGYPELWMQWAYSYCYLIGGALTTAHAYLVARERFRVSYLHQVPPPNEES